MGKGTIFEIGTHFISLNCKHKIRKLTNCIYVLELYEELDATMEVSTLSPGYRDPKVYTYNVTLSS